MLSLGVVDVSCPFCFGFLERTRQDVFRYYRCPHDDERHEHNKDALAALSILRIGLSLVFTGERLAAFDRMFAFADIEVQTNKTIAT